MWIADLDDSNKFFGNSPSPCSLRQLHYRGEPEQSLSARSSQTLEVDPPSMTGLKSIEKRS